MNKLTKVLSVFLLAGALGASVAGVTACKGGNGGNGDGGEGVQHEASHHLTYAPKDDTQHTVSCSVNGCDYAEHDEGHTWSATDTECPDCHEAKPTTGAKFTIPATVDGLIVEGIAQETITLNSTDKTSHTIDKSAIQVYLASDETRGDLVPAANVIISVKKPGGAVITELSGLKEDGAYTVDISLDSTKCEMAQGAQATVADLVKTITVTISNPAQQNSLKVKEGAGVKTTQVQSSTNEILPSWIAAGFEVTLANGDKKDVPASEVTVNGLVTTQPTGNGVAELTWGTITGTQAYTITEDTSKVGQSFSLNFGELTDEQKTKMLTEDVSIQDGRFVVQSRGGKGVVDNTGVDQGPEYDGKYFAYRWNFGGKTLGGDDGYRYIKITTDGSATITAYGYTNNAGGADANRYLSLYQNVTYAPKSEGASVMRATATGLIGEKQNTKNRVYTKHEWTVDTAGTYWLIAEEGDVCITYIQVDQLVTKAQGVEAITLTGESKLAKLKVSHSTEEYKQAFTVGDTFSVDAGYTVKGFYANSATLAFVEEKAVTEGLTYWLGETELIPGTTDLTADLFTALGEQTVTVKSGNAIAATYKIVVESAVSGVTGITASVNLESTKVANASAKLTLNKSNVEAAIVGENANTTVEITSIKYRLKTAEEGTETELTDSVELPVGDYVLLVSATVTDTSTTKSASFDTTFALKVAVEGAATTLKAQDYSSTKLDNANVKIDGVFTVTSDKSLNLTDYPKNSGKAVYKEEGEADVEFTKVWLPGGNVSASNDRGFTITAQKDITVIVYFTVSDGSFGSRTGKLIWTTTTPAAVEGEDPTTVNGESDEVVTEDGKVFAAEITLKAGDSCRVSAVKTGTSNDLRPAIFGFAVTETPAAE